MVVFSLVLFIFNPPSILQEKRSGTVRIKVVAPVSSTNTPSPSMVKSVCKSSDWASTLRRTARVQRSAEASPQRMRAEERNESVNVCAKRRAHNLSSPKEPATGTQACSPCCTPTWSGRMRHWIARARARRGPLPCSSRNTRAALSRDPQTRDAKWARGSRSQTHRRAAKGGFTQTTVRWSEGLVPDRRPPPLFLRCSEKL